MFGLNLPPRTPKPAVPVAKAESCPTKPCGTCGGPMAIVGFDQRCPRCRALVPGSNFCPGACTGCEAGQGD